MSKSGFKFDKGDEVYILDNTSTGEITGKGIVSSQDTFTYDDGKKGIFYSMEDNPLQYYHQELLIPKSEYREERLNNLLDEDREL